MVFWHYLLPFVFFAALIIQLVYILGIFTGLLSHDDHEPDSEQKNKPGVSIIVAAWNELENLKELLPLLEAQDYPDFEIIVSDDRSVDGTYDYLLFNEGNFKKVKFVRIESLPSHFTAKKYAVTMGIKKASKEIILLTDADCRPSSNQWVATMVAQLSQGKDIVLGFSPYEYFDTRLNSLIRYETFQTALQYFSFALAKIPYMGIGRNLMYRRELFWVTNGFSSHHGLLGGDDDLFVNEASNKDNVAVCISSDTHMISEPKKTWSEWITQKRRHLSVGKRYKFRDKFLLGSLAISHLISWFWVLPAFFIKPDWFEAPEWSRIPTYLLDDHNLQDFYPYNDWMRLVTFVFFVWLLIRWIVLAKANNKLNNTISSWKIPYYDMLYAVYYLIFGLITLFSNPKKIKWR
ncbi:glycosyl transferase family 2 [Emticicia oligotrophica DSM 17448]|uniref:Glycosyl transferase family 2 n=1 Tax=Emticicia oligotrophica (strain DSM 17448 / CIP 109782 / MTCC 6937 / GPTSA100-15) TaxID=929562 RepID=A0ABM5N7I2_EMTOG|nr:glycosyltransferase [Emticicia oligotrophica]AFK05399.1 glycosyl transferase family 2 [Emticicia oligotrophica DSM 17448]